MSEALSLRGFSTAMDLYVFLNDRTGPGGMTQAEGLKAVRLLKLPPHLEKDVLRAFSAGGGGATVVTPEQWCYHLEPSKSGASPVKASEWRDLHARAQQSKRETASQFKKIMAEGEKVLRRRLARDLDEALSKASAQPNFSSPGPAQPSPHNRRMAMTKRKPRPIHDVGAASESGVASKQQQRPATLLEKMLLDHMIRINPLITSDPDADDTWWSSNPRLYLSLPRQLVRAEHLDKACKVICSLHFIQNMVRHGGIHTALDALHTLHTALHNGQGRDHVSDYIDFVESNAEALLEDPTAIFQLAQNELDKSQV